MRHDHDYESGFIRAEHDPEDDGLDLDLSMKQLEKLLSGVSVLRLDRLYPRWNSRAYHGLVELRLNGQYSSISESDLIGILRSSPDLHILELGLDIEHPLPIDTQVTTIPLANLEALNVSELICTQLNTLLRWLAPGQNPLQFAVQQRWSEELQLELSLGSFFARSQVTKAYAKGLDFLHIFQLLELSPKLHDLVVSWMRFNPSGPLRGDEIIDTVLYCHLEHFYIIYSSVYIEDILALISVPTFVVKTIAFHWCTLFRNGIEVPNEREESLLEELCRGHPRVVFTIQRPEMPYPLGSWDLYAWYHEF